MLNEPGLTLAPLCRTSAADADGPEVLRACIFGYSYSIFVPCAHFLIKSFRFSNKRRKVEGEVGQRKKFGGHVVNHCPSPGTCGSCRKGEYHDLNAFRASPPNYIRMQAA